jgi:nucleoside-diphosphate-sugar epimerase
MNNFWKDKRVLVTGGAGFIGSKLCELLVGAGSEVTVADNLERGTKENLSKVINDISFIETDLVFLDNCIEATKNVDIVMNLAAKACGIEYSKDHHGEMMTYNALIGMNVLEASRINQVKRVLVVSTSCVYPDDALFPTLENSYNGNPEGVNEGYAWGKIIMEKQAIYYSKEYDMDIAIARPSNVYGAGDLYDGEKSHVIPALIKRIVGGEDPVIIWGSGNQSRAFIHRDDVAKAFMLLTEKHAIGEPVNVGHENGTTIRDLAVKICQVSNLNPVLQFDTSKPEGAPKKSLSTDRLRSVTGFVPKTSINDGLREMIDLFRG